MSNQGSPAFPPFCANSGESHHDITTPFCNRCGVQCLPLDVEASAASLQASAASFRASATSLQANNVVKTPRTMIVPGFRQDPAAQEHQVVNQRIADRKTATGTSNAPLNIGLVTALFLYEPDTSTWKKQGYT